MIQPVPAVNLSNDLTRIARAMQAERTGHTPKAVTVVASDNTIVFTSRRPSLQLRRFSLRLSRGRRRWSSIIGRSSPCHAASCAKKLAGSPAGGFGKRPRPWSLQRVRSFRRLPVAQSCTFSNWSRVTGQPTNVSGKRRPLPQSSWRHMLREVTLGRGARFPRATRRTACGTAPRTGRNPRFRTARERRSRGHCG